MIYLFNKIFGWDYIHWSNSADSGNARVRKSPDGKVWYYRYRNTCVIDVIRNTDDVIWLTCHPSKYFTPCI